MTHVPHERPASSSGLDTTLGRGRGQLSTQQLPAYKDAHTLWFGRTSQHASAVFIMRRGRAECDQAATGLKTKESAVRAVSKAAAHHQVGRQGKR